MSALVLIRHGQSQWNLENRFTGWTDVPLTEQGQKDASLSAHSLAGFHFTTAFTSRLLRANQTLDVIVKKLNLTMPIEKDSALNERHYGDLQGLNKAETVEKFGKEQVQLWRRSYFTRPPNGESMEDCERRTVPFFTQYIFPLVQAGQDILVVAHGNSLRPIMKYLENLDPEVVATLEIGLCTPYVYTFESGKMTGKRVIEVEGIVTKGSSLEQKTVEGGRI